MSSSLVRQDLIPVLAGYLIVMAALGTGLRLTLRSAGDRRRAAAGRAVDPVPGDAEAIRAVDSLTRDGDVDVGHAVGSSGARPGGQVSAAGWRRLITHAVGTAVGGYLLLMIIVVVYYYGVARVGGAFMKSAFTGCALLIGLAAPVFAAASWLAERREERAGRERAPRGSTRPSTPSTPS
jgi:hypothetical protein